jgi:hypothetical protein
VLPFEKIQEPIDNTRNNLITIDTEGENKSMATSSKLLDSFTD